MNIGKRMIAERQREVAVGIKALRMMQEHYGNQCLSFKCVSPAEELEWYAKAEKLIPPLDFPDDQPPPILTELEIAALCGGKKAARRITRSVQDEFMESPTKKYDAYPGGSPYRARSLFLKLLKFRQGPTLTTGKQGAMRTAAERDRAKKSREGS